MQIGMHTLQISSTLRNGKVVWFNLTISGITATILSKKRKIKNKSLTFNIRNKSNHAEYLQNNYP